MKRNPFNLEDYRNRFSHIGPVSEHVYDLGDGITEAYAQVEIAPDIIAVFHDDLNEIALKVGYTDLFAVEWNADTEELLHLFGAIEPHEGFAKLAAYAVVSAA